MKKKVLSVLVVVLAFGFIGCANFQLSDDSNSLMTGYLAGKGMGIVVQKWAPEAVITLEKHWNAMMAMDPESNVVSNDRLLRFFNDSMEIIRIYYDDPYELTTDLKMLLRAYGGQLNTDGQIVQLEPIPREVCEWFGEGWASGVRLQKTQDLKEAKDD